MTPLVSPELDRYIRELLPARHPVIAEMEGEALTRDIPIVGPAVATLLALLVAMVGAIVLTLRHKPNVKRQNVADQVARTKATAIEIVKVRPGQGLS